MSDRDGSRSPKEMIDREHSPHARREDSPNTNNHKKGKSYSRSPSRSKKMSYREDDREKRRGSGRDYKRERSRSRSRSSHRRHKRYSRSGSRSPGGGYSRRGRSHSRSHSRSPMSQRRRHQGTRDNPEPTRCLGVFGLSVYTTEDELYHIFSKYGPVERVQVVIDAKTGRSRGFSFVYFEAVEDAKVAKEQCSGMKINGKNIRVDYSITERAHTPTPGIYMGKPTYSSDRYDRRGGGGGYRDSYYRSSRYRHRSPSPSYSRRRRYSRSRSYSPRRY